MIEYFAKLLHNADLGTVRLWTLPASLLFPKLTDEGMQTSSKKKVFFSCTKLIVSVTYKTNPLKSFFIFLFTAQTVSVLDKNTKCSFGVIESYAARDPMARVHFVHYNVKKNVLCRWNKHIFSVQFGTEFSLKSTPHEKYTYVVFLRGNLVVIDESIKILIEFFFSVHNKILIFHL